MSALIHPIESAQPSETAPSEMRWLMRPSFPTTLVIRSSSRLIRSLIAMTSLKVSATLPASPVQSSGKRTEKLPRLNAVNALSNCFSSTWLSPLNREPFAGRTIEIGVDFFITNQQNEQSEGESAL